jgi:uncharacterized membrane protein
MKHLSILLFCLAITTIVTGQTPNPSVDPIVSNLLPPDFIMARLNEIQATNEQRKALANAISSTHQTLQPAEEALREAHAKFARYLAMDSIENQAALELLNPVLEAEATVKRLQLDLLVTLHRVLTPEQRKQLKLTQAKLPYPGTPTAAALEERLHAKVKKVQAAVEEQASRGEPPFEIMEAMEAFGEFMKKGQHEAAEELLDRVLHHLEKP